MFNIKNVITKLRVGVVSLISGLMVGAFGVWLTWDVYSWSLIHPPYIEGDAWRFYWPFPPYLGYVGVQQCSLPYDVGIALTIFGFLVLTPFAVCLLTLVSKKLGE